MLSALSHRGVGVILYLCVAFTPVSARADHLRMGVGDWCPYVCNPATADGREGYLVDIFREIFENAGVSVETVFLPFARNIQMNRTGQLDGIIGVYRTDVRDFYFPSVHLGKGYSHFYTLRDSDWRFRDESSLASLTSLGSVKGYDYGSELLQRFIDSRPERNRVVTGNDPQQRLAQLLLRGRILAFVEDNNVAGYTIESMGVSSQVISVGQIGGAMPVYAVFSPAMKADRAAIYFTLLAEGLEQLREDGRLADILGRYGVADWEKH